MRIRLSVLAGVSALCFASAASAETITLLDNIASAAVQKCADQPGVDPCDGGFGPYSYSNEPTFEGYANTVTSASAPSWAQGKTFKWGDVIGDANNFELYSLTITKTANSITFTQRTQFDGTNGSHNLTARTSHMFIDTLTPLIADTFNYAIVLGTDQVNANLQVRSDWNPQVAGTQVMTTSGLYKVTSANLKSPADLWTSGGWGGLIQFCQDVPADPGICDATASSGAAIAPPVLAVGMTAADKVGDVTWSRTDVGGGWWDLTAVITNVNMSIFDQFDVLATVADCANDALWGPTDLQNHVPVPGAVFLLGFGLLGLGALRRRKAA